MDQVVEAEKHIKKQFDSFIYTMWYRCHEKCGWFSIDTGYYITHVNIYFRSKDYFTVEMTDYQEYEIFTTVQPPERLERVVDYLNYEPTPARLFHGEKKTLSKRKLNYMCKILATWSKSWSIKSFLFDNCSMISKILCSLSNLSSFLFESCKFEFEGVLKVSKLQTYPWKLAYFLCCTFTTYTLKVLIKALIHTRTKPEFELKFEGCKLLSDTIPSDILYEKIGMGFKKVNNHVEINRMRCFISSIKDLDEILH